jgi:2,4-dienoyl-CoA reductase (NADPH2)
MTDPYPHLLSPLTIGRHTLKNRVIMGSMHSRLEMLDRAAEREAAFYAERAKGGAALIITAGISPNQEGRLEPGAMSSMIRRKSRIIEPSPTRSTPMGPRCCCRFCIPAATPSTT